MKNNIKKLRDQLGITQNQLARKVEVSEKTIYNIEKGMDTKITLAFKIKKVLKVNKIEDIWKE